MPTRPLKPTLLLILILLISSCTPQPTPSPVLSNVEGLIPSIEPTPISTPTLPTPTPTQKPRVQNPPQGQGSDASQSLDFEIPSHPYDVILGRPTSNSITFSLLAYADQTLSISYGTESGNYTSQTEPINLTAKTPQTFQLSNLQPDTQYFYSINGGSENTFHTARPAGSMFTFTIQADSHLDSNTSAEVYLQTLANQRADHPDFVIDMGDTFMTDKYKPHTDAFPQYLAQRYFLGQLADTAPLFLVLGNHDGEGAPRGKNGEEMSVWSAQLRTQYFPNPVPNGFYTGNTSPHSTVGDLQNYYAFIWGDALFIVLDPYWFTPPTKGNTANLWNPTLGEEQYQWLKSTLETSNAKWKFVFIHQLIGGLEKDGRGGMEVAPYHEWGGLNPDGQYGFDENRPGWGVPIHQLLLANHVNAVFHGHDHLFVQQELDGIIYQEIPQPGSARPNSTDSAADYGYINGTILGGPGHMRVVVSPDQVTVDYVRSYVDEKPDQKNGQVDFSYTITP
ncbi:MAG: metallophosphoesterase family protein [Chloroflexi bacterium]|nr:metallophosphoesterase family protein [Chloroflexota bacterium]